MTEEMIENGRAEAEAAHRAERVAQEGLPVAQPQLDRSEIAWRLDERKAMGIAKASAALPRAFQNKPGDVLAVWLMADELGLSRMAALRGMYVVNGKPQLSGDLLLAVARAEGCRVSERIEYGRNAEGEPDEDVNRATAVCEVTLPGGELVAAAFSAGDAVRAGLWGSTDPWKKYPLRMLQMRARGFALRDAIPHRLAGCYAPGEIVDVTPHEVER